MRLGIRPQLVLALASLLLLAFLPLFFAVASLTRATMASVHEANARALGRAIAGHVMAAAPARAQPEVERLLRAQLGQRSVAAVGIYDGAGKLALRAADEGFDSALPETVATSSERFEAVSTAHGSALLVVVPDDERPGSVAVLLRSDPGSVPWTPLVRLVALYTGIVGLALLVFSYIAMTRLVVRPIDALSNAARKVADGARTLDPPGGGAAELVDLGSSLSMMTARLRADEQTMREKIAEIERATRDLTRAQERLVRSERLASVGRLAAGLAHEIGNPIAAILGFQELLLQGGLEPSEERDFLERMKKETERVHKILRDLLDFARPAVARKGDSMRPPEPTGSVADAVRDVLALVNPQRGFKSIDLETDIAPDLPQVSLSHERIVQVLLNLLLNASDVVPQRGGRVRVRAARASADRVRIEVEDNGPGIPDAIKEHLFEPFVTTKEVGKGTGLGLAVCRGLVEAVGGSIAAEAGDEGGARFVVELPGA